MAMSRARYEQFKERLMAPPACYFCRVCSTVYNPLHGHVCALRITIPGFSSVSSIEPDRVVRFDRAVLDAIEAESD